MNIKHLEIIDRCNSCSAYPFNPFVLIVGGQFVCECKNCGFHMPFCINIDGKAVLVDPDKMFSRED